VNKNLAEFDFRGQRSELKVTGDKKRKNAESSELTMHSTAYVAGRKQQSATDDIIAWPPGVTGYAGGKISACCLVCISETVDDSCFRNNRTVISRQ